MGEVKQYAFEIAQGDMFANGQSFYLVEHGLLGGVYRLVTVDFAGENDADGLRSVCAHGMYLSPPGMSSQDQAGRGGIEALPHIPARAPRRPLHHLHIYFL